MPGLQPELARDQVELLVHCASSSEESAFG